MKFQPLALSLALSLVLLSALGATQATAQTFDVSAEACAAEFSDGRMEVSLSAISFWESTCDILSRDVQADGSVRMDLACHGEGEEWPMQLTMAPQGAQDLAISIDGGEARNYVACPAAN